MVEILERYQVQLYLVALAVGALAGFMPPIAHLADSCTLLALGLLLWATFMSIPLRRSEQKNHRLSWSFLTQLLLINFAMVPAVAGLLVVLFPLQQDMAFAAIVVLLAPCIDYVVVFCALAGGDSRSLLRATPLLLGVQAIAIPGYLWLFHQFGLWNLEIPPHALGRSTMSVVVALAVVVIPLLLAWVFQGSSQTVGNFAHHTATVSMVPLMMTTLFCAVAAHIAAVVQHIDEILWLAGTYIAFATVMGVGVWVLTRGRSHQQTNRGERKSLVFSGVTRNALVILPVALAIAEIANQPLLPIAIMTQTLVELVAMVIMVGILRAKKIDPEQSS